MTEFAAAPGASAQSAGEVEILADADRPGGWLLLIDRIRQSYVDLDDPTYLDFEYVQVLAQLLDALPAGRLRVTHIGGGAGTVARYVAVTRPGSPQIVLEPDAALTALVRARLPFPRSARIRVRATDGRSGVAALADASADVVVLDAFAGGRVPAELTTQEFLADVARVLGAGGVFLANVADGHPLTYTRRVLATLRTQFGATLLVTDPALLKGRRYANVVFAAGAVLPVGDVRRAAAGAAFPRAVRTSLPGDAKPLTDDDPMRSPPPPEESWRIPREDEY
ncbi:spermidine synthase [uncultured Jatrophihabitans sp.]|uniref:spermidine synthase n=1 Tax=uncultured Jatrophihabitans sp. TaxID=1610747 RepID=UPI0035CBFED8